jgi:hypothetical protein
MALINTTTTGVLGTTIFGDGSGDLTVQQNGVTVNKITVAPAFSAYQSVSQTLSNNAYNKITLTTESFDTNSNYDTSTSRFTPTVAGYYYVSGRATAVTTSTSDQLGAYIRKNATAFINQGTAITGLTNFYPTAVVTDLIYMNGSTDFIELYVYLGSSATKASANDSQSTAFGATLVRAA